MKIHSLIQSHVLYNVNQISAKWHHVMNKLIWKKNLLEDKFGEDSKQFVGGVMGEKRDWLNMIWTVIYCAA